MALNTSEEVFCPMTHTTIKRGQCVDIHFELMGGPDPVNLMTLVKSYHMSYEDIQEACAKCPFRPFTMGVEEQSE